MWNPFKRWSASQPSDCSTGSSCWRFSAAMLSDVGCDREVNEDAGRFLNLTSHPQAGRRGILGVVADGMGGHQAGEIASQVTVDVVCRAYSDSKCGPSQALANAVIAANRAVYEMASRDERLAGMGTTCTALAICQGSAYVAHVGDSRAYLLRDGSLYQMTEDDSVVEELVRKGVILPEEAREHPAKNVLQRAMGRHPALNVSCWSEGAALRFGDKYLLCSDGLCGVLPDEIIRQVVIECEPADACGHLIALTRRAGAPDNVTVGIVKVDRPASGDSSLPPTRELDVYPKEAIIGAGERLMDG